MLMAINVAVFLAQFVSKDKLLLMGAKVVLLTLPESSSIHGPRLPCLTCIHMHISIGTGCSLSTAVMPYRPILHVVRPLIQCFLQEVDKSSTVAYLCPHVAFVLALCLEAHSQKPHVAELE